MTYPKAIIFDFLTALLDSWTLWNAAAGDKEAGRRWRARYLELTYGCGPYKPYEDLVAQAAKDVDLSSDVPARLLSSWSELKPWPEAPEVLAKLRARGVKLGIITNSSVELGRRAAAACMVPFDAVVTSEEAGFYKPHPTAYLAVLRALGVSPGEALFVAGSSADVPGASGVGMQVVWHNHVRLTALSGSPSPLREGCNLDEALAGIL